MKKKKYPLEVMKLLDKISKMNYDFIEISFGNKVLLDVKDLDNESDFYFIIESFNNYTTYYDHESIDSIKYKVTRKPKNEIFNNETTEELNSLVVFDSFKKWIEVIKQYNDIDIERKDPIVLFYEDEFYNRFKIVDLDAEVNPFGLDQQFALSEHIDNIIDLFKESHDGLSEQIVNESVQLKKDLTTKNKAIVFRQLCKIWGMIRKKGIDILKLVLTKGFDKLVELSISKGFDRLMELL